MKFLLFNFSLFCFYLLSSAFQYNSVIPSRNAICRRQTALKHSEIPSADASQKDSEFQKWICPSCSYVYVSCVYMYCRLLLMCKNQDEANGYKKKHPPGTKFSDIPVFLCPVCGASKVQFKLLSEESPP